MSSPDPRRSAAAQWLSKLRGTRPEQIEPASADASFRRYFRVTEDSGESLILMDAPPDKEPLDAFLAVADLFEAAGLHVPARLAVNQDDGFLLLEDLGRTDFLTALAGQSATTAKPLYREAWQALVRLQAWGLAQPAPQLAGLPIYSAERLTAEMQLFSEWYAPVHKGLPLTDEEQAALSSIQDLLVRQALAQPQVIVHRDFHSRNLMVLPSDGPGVIDFQDAVLGPITYDLASLLRDAYKPWEEAEQIDFAIGYWEDARRAGLPIADDFSEFWRDFEWMGLQRHLKVLGIFARLSHRDGKHGYLNDLPVVLRDTRRVAQRYNAFGPLLKILDRLDGDAPGVGYTF